VSRIVPFFSKLFRIAIDELDDKVTITLLNHWRKDGLIPYVPLSCLSIAETNSGMGQDRHFFRVAIHGLEKSFTPDPEPEEVSLMSPPAWQESILTGVGRTNRDQGRPY
jgi:hypothetical protein